MMLSTPKVKAELFLASSLSDGLEDNNIKQVTTLLLNKEADPNVLIPVQGVTPFHLVIGNNSEIFAEEVTKLFLRHGGNPNVRSIDGMTPVHVAAAWGRIGILELLLANGGDPLYLDDDGCSPFHYAFDGAYYDAIAVLGKYCEEASDKHSEPKYERVLDKIFINTGDLMAEYIVSETPSEITTLQSSITYNNNSDVLSALKYSPTNTTFTDCTQNGCSNQNMKNFSSTMSESSCSIDKFVTRKQRHLCLPRKGKKKEGIRTDAKVNFDFGERSIEEEKLLISQIISCLSVSLTSDSTIDESFFVPTKIKAEQMPRISSPKADQDRIYLKLEEKLKNCEYDTKKTNITPQTSKKQPVPFKYKSETPLGISPKREPVSQRKKTPLFVAKTSQLKTTPTVKKNMITPCKYASKLTYSPDCSIISHSPNLIITPNTKRKEKVTKTPSLQKQTSSKIPKRTVPSKVKALTACKSKTDNSPSYNKYPNDRMLSKNQNHLYSSPKTLTNNDFPRTNELNKTTSLPKQRLKSSSKNNNNVKQTGKVATLNRACRKDEFGLILFSPEVEVTNKPIDRKFLSKNVVMKLDEYMYDEDIKRKSDSINDRKFVALNKNGVEISRINTLPSEESNLFSETKSKIDKCNVTKNLIKTEWKTVNTSMKHSCASNPLTEHSKQFRKGMLESKSTLNTNSRIFNSKSKSAHMNLGKTDIPLTKELDDSSISTDASIFSDSSSDNNVSNNNKLSNNIVLKDELPDHIKAIDTRDSNFFQKFNLSPLWIHDNLSRSSKDIFSKMINSSVSLVSVEEEYKYKDAEKGVTLLERRLRTTLARVPSATNIIKSCSLEDDNISQYSSTSYLSDLPQEMLLIDKHTLRQKLFKLGDEPGPITKSTYRVYLKRLLNLERAECIADKSTSPNNKRLKNYDERKDYTNKFNTSLWSTNWMTHLDTCRMLEQRMSQEFIRPDATRRWREGTTKTSFNYLLLDSRITRDLPHRGIDLSLSEKWETFLSAIFYIGKGKHFRPFSHLYDAFSIWIMKGRPERENKKLRRIVDIWNDGHGVVSLHVFQNTIPVEAYTREAAMIEALGTENLENCNSGNYYGIATTWGVQEKRKLGKYLLYKAMEILMYEGERQLFPENL